MLRALVNVFIVPDLRKKILFTLALLCIYRIGFHIAIPGFNIEKIQQITASRDADGAFERVAETLQMFTGGTLSQSSLFGLGIMPYISASIILMLGGEVFAFLRKLKEEGASGYKKIQEYTRYLTVGLCFVQSIIYLKYFIRQGFTYPGMEMQAYIFGIVGMTAGTMFLMWLGEQIDEFGIGNGISLLIMAGIISRMPWAILEIGKKATWSVNAVEAGAYTPIKIGFVILCFIGVVAGAILITQAQRRIPIQQAKQMRGRKMYGGQRHYLPLRLNQASVMPIIFASSLMMFPNMVFRQLHQVFPESRFWEMMVNAFDNSSFTYNFLFIVMIYLFTFFWVTVQFRPKDMAKRLRDSGSFVPGLRPGHRTAEYLEMVMMRITFYGASFLAFIAVVPSMIAIWGGVDWRIASFLGGTGLLIVVSVSLDLVQKAESQLLMRNYDGFSDAGKIRGVNG